MGTPVQSHLVEVGHVARAHGVRGVLRIEGTSSGALGVLTRVFLSGEEAPRRVESAEQAHSAWLVKLEGVADRNAAEALRGRVVHARRDELPPPADDEVYVADLVGCAVYDLAGTLLGTVNQVFPSGAHEILVIARPDGREAMVPLVEPIVTHVDIEGRRIECDPPEGLLDL